MYVVSIYLVQISSTRELHLWLPHHPLVGASFSGKSHEICVIAELQPGAGERVKVKVKAKQRREG